MLEVKITNEEKIKITLAPVTSTGKTAKVDGVPQWNVLSGAATVEPAEDGMSAYIVSSDDDLSDTQVQVTADADLGEGVETVSDVITVKTVGAKAESLGMVAGSPEAK